MFYRLFVMVFLLATVLHADEEDEDVRRVLVTVAPHKYLVERIAGNTVQVEVIVPATGNVHTYEPTPKQMMRMAEADLWFRLGESFEKRLAESLKAHRPTLEIVDLRQGLDLIQGDQEHAVCCHGEGMDLHYWLSPTQLKIQARSVTRQLSDRYPEYSDRYRKALEEHLYELNHLDHELRLQLARVKGRTILVTHPAYGYLCRDYGLKQLSVEMEGKDPTPQELTKLLRKIKALKIKTVFTQVQYSPKVADLIVNQLGEGARTVTLDPYAEDYMQNMRSIAHHFSRA